MISTACNKKSKIGEDYSCSSDDDDSLNEIKMHFHRFPENFLSLIISSRSCWVCLSLTYEIFMIIKRFNVAFYGRNLLSPHCLFSPFLLLVLRQKRCEKSHFCSIEYRQHFFLCFLEEYCRQMMVVTATDDECGERVRERRA